MTLATQYDQRVHVHVAHVVPCAERERWFVRTSTGVPAATLATVGHQLLDRRLHCESVRHRSHPVAERPGRVISG